MSQDRTLEELLFVGGILVEVGFGLTGYLEARTVSSLKGHAYPGGEIRVRLYEDDVVEDKDGRIYARPEAWAELLHEMRDTLARCMILGRMVVASENLVLQTDEKNRESIRKAKKLLGEGFLNITLDTAMRALKERFERYEEEQKVRGG